MKTIITTIALAFAATVANAQEDQKPGVATWVVESTVKQPKSQVVKYYDANLKLITQDTVNGKRLNISSARIQKKMNKKLDELIRDSAIRNEQVLAIKE